MKKGGVAVLSTLIGAVAGAAAVGKVQGKTINQKAEKVDKFKGYYNMLNQWLVIKQEGKSLEKYFTDNGYKTIAIYGMGEMGNRLYDELKGTSVTVKYAVDKNAASTYSELDVIDPEDDYEEVDAIVVSAIFAFDEIEEMLSDKVDFPVPDSAFGTFLRRESTFLCSDRDRGAHYAGRLEIGVESLVAAGAIVTKNVCISRNGWSRQMTSHLMKYKFSRQDHRLSTVRRLQIALTPRTQHPPKIRPESPPYRSASPRSHRTQRKCSEGGVGSFVSTT